MDAGELLTRWTARLAVLLYVSALALRSGASDHPNWRRLCRLLWTAGCLVYLIHVVCAFGFVHQWSHAEAYAATARQTDQTVGVHWGGGLYFNYAFTLLWVADVCWWWLGLERYEARPQVIAWMVHGFLGFIVFNATVVFASGLSRWIGIAASLILATVWLGRALRSRK